MNWLHQYLRDAQPSGVVLGSPCGACAVRPFSFCSDLTIDEHVASNELALAQDQILLLGRKRAKEKVATMLLMFSKRAKRRGMPDNPVFLPMTREDIGDYLGMTTETVSRIITQLKTTGVIRLEAENNVRLLDIDALAAMSEGFDN